MTLWLDDLRPPEKHGFVGATWVKTAEDCIRELEKGIYDFVSLDHDLSAEATMGLPVPDEETGYSVVCWLEQHPGYWPKRGVRVHSLNPAGKQRMLQVVKRYYGRTFQP